MRTVLFLMMFFLPVTAFADDGVVARAGGIEVTAGDLRAYLSTLPDAERTALAADPALLSQAVRLYLAGRMVLKEAIAGKFDQRPEVKVQLDRVRDAALTELYLQSAAKAPEEYPSEAELRAAYEANKSAFRTPRSYRLAQIFVAAPPDAKTSARLDEVVRKLKAKGADFAAIARDHSDNKAETAKGGEIGWLSEPQMMPAIVRALAGLKKGAVSDPVRLDDGWHVLKLLDDRPAAAPLPLSEVRAVLAEQLRRQRAAQERQAYLADLIRRNPPALNELALSKLMSTSK
jgi:Parvulin-like peptidyl-prolyl isomerase